MTQDAASRAAERIKKECVTLGLSIDNRHNIYATEEAISIIQQAITEAVDAAVAPKEKRVKELEAVTNLAAYEAELRSKPEVPFPGCAEWQRNPDLMTQHFVWLAYKNCADKLQSLLHPEDK